MFFSQRGIALGKFCDFRKNRKSHEKKHTIFIARPVHDIGGSNRVLKNKNIKSVLKQKRFGKILRFIKKFCDF